MNTCLKLKTNIELGLVNYLIAIVQLLDLKTNIELGWLII